MTSLKIDLSEDSFQESKSFELEIPVVSDPVVQQMSVKGKLFKSIQHLSVPRILYYLSSEMVTFRHFCQCFNRLLKAALTSIYFHAAASPSH